MAELIKPRPRRIKRLLFTADCFLELLKRMDGSEVITATGLPADAKVVGMTSVDGFYGLDAQPGVFLLLIESAEFPPVEDGQRYPEMTLEFRADPVKHNDY